LPKHKSDRDCFERVPNAWYFSGASISASLDLDFLLIAIENGQSIAIGYVNNHSDECFRLSHREMKATYCNEVTVY